MPAIELLLTVLVIALPLIGLAWAARKRLTLFVLLVEDGRITNVTGRMPQRLFDDIADVVARERPARLRVACRIEDGLAVLHFDANADAGLRQVMRNLVGEYPAVRLKGANRIRRR
ncbi:MAG: DUF3634 family protein [Polyangiaceae bacterium]